MMPINENDTANTSPAAQATQAIGPSLFARCYSAPDAAAPRRSAARARKVDAELCGYVARRRCAEDHIASAMHLVEVREDALFLHIPGCDSFEKYLDLRFGEGSHDHCRRHMKLAALPREKFIGVSMTQECLVAAVGVGPRCLEALIDCARQDFKLSKDRILKCCAFAKSQNVEDTWAAPRGYGAAAGEHAAAQAAARRGYADGGPGAARDDHPHGRGGYAGGALPRARPARRPAGGGDHRARAPRGGHHQQHGGALSQQPARGPGEAPGADRPGGSGPSQHGP